jgi:hypothetical protein
VASKKQNTGQPRVFAYIIRTVGPGYRLTGFVPWVSNRKVFFGACKKKMRPHVKRGDYIMGISGSGAGRPRRVLLWMRVAEPMSFRDAYEKGRTNNAFFNVRGKAIHLRPCKDVAYIRGNPECYVHIKGAHHEDDWRSDVKGNRDAFLVGRGGSWVAEVEGPIITPELVELLSGGFPSTWKGHATVSNPLTQYARGKHVLVTGETAQRIVSWIQREQQGVRNPIQSSSGSRIACARICSCR